MTSVDIYTKPGCGYCNKAKSLLFREGISYNEYDASQTYVKEQLMLRNPEARSVPQIFWNGHAVGGYNELVEYIDNVRGGYGEYFGTAGQNVLTG